MQVLLSFLTKYPNPVGKRIIQAQRVLYHSLLKYLCAFSTLMLFVTCQILSPLWRRKIEVQKNKAKGFDEPWWPSWKAKDLIISEFSALYIYFNFHWRSFRSFALDFSCCCELPTPWSPARHCNVVPWAFQAHSSVLCKAAQFNSAQVQGKPSFPGNRLEQGSKRDKES